MMDSNIGENQKLLSHEDKEKIQEDISLDKICRMYKNAIENGFASYAEA